MFVYDASIETGNRIIDGEHRQLIDTINQMLSAVVRGESAEETARAFAFLNEYIEKHFSHEESLQVQYRYPDYERHKHLHDGYRESVKKLTEEFRRTGPTQLMVNKLSNNIGGWLVNHIKREDKALAAYIRSKSKRSS